MADAAGAGWAGVRSAWESLRATAQGHLQGFKQSGGLRGHINRSAEQAGQYISSNAGQAGLQKHGLGIAGNWLASQAARQRHLGRHGGGLGSFAMAQLYSFAHEHVQKHMSALGAQQAGFELAAKFMRGDTANMSDKELRALSESAHAHLPAHQVDVARNQIHAELTRRKKERMAPAAEAAAHFRQQRMDQAHADLVRSQMTRTAAHGTRVAMTGEESRKTASHRTEEMSKRQAGTREHQAATQRAAREHQMKSQHLREEHLRERGTIKHDALTQRHAALQEHAAAMGGHRASAQETTRAHLTAMQGQRLAYSHAVATQHREAAQLSHEQNIQHGRESRKEYRKGLHAAASVLVPMMRDPQIGVRGVDALAKHLRAPSYDIQARGGATRRITEANIAGVRNDPAIAQLLGSKYSPKRRAEPMRPGTPPRGREVHEQAGRVKRATEAAKERKAKAEQAQPKGSPRTRAEQASRHRAEKAEQAGGASYKVEVRTVRGKGGKTHKQRYKVRADAAGAKKRTSRRK